MFNKLLILFCLEETESLHLGFFILLLWRFAIYFSAQTGQQQGHSAGLPGSVLPLCLGDEPSTSCFHYTSTLEISLLTGRRVSQQSIKGKIPLTVLPRDTTLLSSLYPGDECVSASTKKNVLETCCLASLSLWLLPLLTLSPQPRDEAFLLVYQGESPLFNLSLQSRSSVCAGIPRDCFFTHSLSNQGAVPLYWSTSGSNFYLHYLYDLMLMLSAGVCIYSLWEMHHPLNGELPSSYL